MKVEFDKKSEEIIYTPETVEDAFDLGFVFAKCDFGTARHKIEGGFCSIRFKAEAILRRLRWGK